VQQTRRQFLQSVVIGAAFGWESLNRLPAGQPRLERSKQVERLVRLGILQSERGERGDGDYQQAAIAAFTQALDIDPNCQAAYRLRGRSHDAAGDYQQAVEDLSTAIRLDPTDEEAFVYRSVAFKMMNEDGKAIADRTAIIRLNPSAFNFYMRGGDALWYDPALAVADLTEAIRQNPQHADAYYLRALAHENKRDYRLAAADYAENMRLDPKKAERTAENYRRAEQEANRLAAAGSFWV
jgi:tetratricopeptide (TPR) repeat protein